MSQANNQHEAGGLYFSPENGGSMFFRNGDELLPDSMALHPRR
jgi:hypothetical protein